MDLVRKTGYLKPGDSSLGPWSVTSGGEKLQPFLKIPPLKLTKSDSNYMSLIYTVNITNS